MRYRVRHTTRYHYSEMVPLCHNEVHLLPRNLSRQRCIDAWLDISPSPKVRHERKDFFGNRVVYFSIEEPHTALEVTAQSEVELLPMPSPDLETTVAWEVVQSLLRHETNRGALEARQFLLDSPFIRTPMPFAEYAQPSFVSGRPLLSAVQDLMRRIHSEFAYDPQFTTVATPISEVFTHKRGVCQDFAHFAIACLRAVGIAARYVSGYLETLPPRDQPKLVGTAASHAWVSVYCPELGWIDFDPTNNLMPSSQHIVVAWGRDYSDVSPVKGTILGGVEHDLQVGVEVQKIETTESSL